MYPLDEELPEIDSVEDVKEWLYRKELG